MLELCVRDPRCAGKRRQGLEPKTTGSAGKRRVSVKTPGPTELLLLMLPLHCNASGSLAVPDHIGFDSLPTVLSRTAVSVRRTITLKHCS